jgi:hypothetical protein
MNELKEEKTQPYSFMKGWMKVRQEDVGKARAKLMLALGITTRKAFLNRLSGKITPMHDEYAKIEKIFAEFGITEIWGDL